MVRNDKTITVLLRVEYDTGEWITLDKVHRINVEDKDSFIETLNSVLDLKVEYYKDKYVKRLIMQY